MLKVSRVGDADFNRVLHAFGYGKHKVEVTTMQSPAPPAGAQLLSAVE